LADLVHPASFHDVGMNVEVGKEREHYEHIAGEKVLSPDGKVTVEVDTVECMCQRDGELNLNVNIYNIQL